MNGIITKPCSYCGADIRDHDADWLNECRINYAEYLKAGA